MPQTRSNGTQTPVNADTFNLTGDLATMAESITSIVSVANQAAGDSIATSRAAAGFAVSDAKPLFCWDQSQNALIVKNSSGWHGGTRPFGHMGLTSGFFGLVGAGSIVPFSAAQELRGGMTFDSTSHSLVIPRTGDYRFTIKGMGTGASGVVCWVKCQQNLTDLDGTYSTSYKPFSDDQHWSHSVTRALTSGDKINVIHGFGTGASQSTWGTTGYNGCWVEIQYVDPF